MKGDRTYISFRRWPDVDTSFPASVFDSVTDDQLLTTLEFCGATCLMGLRGGPLQEWATSALKTVPNYVPTLTEYGARYVAGAVEFFRLKGRTYPVQPWTVFHAESSPEHAARVIDLLPSCITFVEPFRFRTTRKASLDPSVWIPIERQLERLQAAKQLEIPMSILVRESRAISRLLRQDQKESDSQRVAMKFQDVPKTGTGAVIFAAGAAAQAGTGAVVELNPVGTSSPAVARAVRSYEWVCSVAPDLVPASPQMYSKEQWEHIKDHDCSEYKDDEGKQLEVPEFETWKRYVRAGRADPDNPKTSPRAGRPHGRSIVSQDDI